MSVSRRGCLSAKLKHCHLRRRVCRAGATRGAARGAGWRMPAGGCAARTAATAPAGGWRARSAWRSAGRTSISAMCAAPSPASPGPLLRDAGRQHGRRDAGRLLRPDTDILHVRRMTRAAACSCAAGLPPCLFLLFVQLVLLFPLLTVSAFSASLVRSLTLLIPAALHPAPLSLLLTQPSTGPAPCRPLFPRTAPTRPSMLPGWANPSSEESETEH